MACVGFDAGSRFSVVARVHSRGLTTALNEASKRKSGSLLSIKGKQRFLGSNAEPVARSNYKNTVFYATRLVGRRFADPEVQAELQHMPYREIFEETKDGGIAARLTYDGEKQAFSMTQCYAMLLGELKRVAIADAPDGVNDVDVVLTVPTWYDDRQRRAVKAACRMAQVGVLGMINDSTATGLIWGIWKNKKGHFDDKAAAGGGAAAAGKDGEGASKASAEHVGPCNIMFIDLGDSQMSCTVARYQKDQMQTLTVTHDKMLGGRLIDAEVAKFAAEGFKGGDIFSNPKALIKLLGAAEKAKKTLTGGISQTKVYCECLMNDRDLNVTLTKEKLEEIMAPLLERFVAPIKRALSETGLTGADFHAVEIVGGSMRIPAFKKAAAKALGIFKDDPNCNYGLANTLDMEEAAAHGAAMKCALLSPKFRIQTTFDIVENVMYPIKLTWEGAAPRLGNPPLPPVDGSADDDAQAQAAAAEREGKEGGGAVLTIGDSSSMVLFDRNAKCGAGKAGARKISFQRNQAFAITAAYHGAATPSSQEAIAQLKITSVPDVVNKNATVAPWITISVQQDGNGLLSFKNASAVETYVRETTTYPPAPAPKPVADEGKKEGGKTEDGKTEDAPSAEAEAAPADVEAEAAPADAEAEAAAPVAEAAPDPAPAEPAAAPEPVVKKTRKFRDVNVPTSVEVMGQLSAKAVMECEEAECKMAQQDRLIKETEDARNDLETFVYSTRDMLDIALADYVSEEEKASMKGDLQSEEDWLYSDEGYDADKKTFVARLSALQKKGSVFTTREAEANGREAACKQLTDTIRKYRDIVDSVNTKDQERYEHLTDEQRQQVREKCDAAQGWLAENREAQKALPLSVDPVLTIKLCKEQRKEVIGVCKPIVNTPKPQPPKEEPKAPEAAADGDAAAAAAAAAGKEGDAAAAPEESGASKEGAEAPAAEAEAPAAAAGKEGEIPEGMPADTTFD